MVKRKLALLSVSDKRGIETMARGLTDLGFEILSTGGTAKAIRAAGVAVIKIADHTGAPEIMDGRVKTLHPKIHGGILARDKAEHLADLERIDAALIDLVVVNLYPFERTAASPAALLPDVVEQIDIGGPCLLRAAAKTFERVTVVCDPGDYETVLWHLARERQVPAAFRFEPAIQAFTHTAAYDTAISNALPGYDSGSGKKRGGPR